MPTRLPPVGQVLPLVALWLLGFAGIFEGINALVRLASGANPRRWFLPFTHVVPPPYWTATSVGLLLVGLAACGIFTWLVQRHRDTYPPEGRAVS